LSWKGENFGMKILVPVSPLEKQDPSMKESRHPHSVNINSSCA